MRRYPTFAFRQAVSGALLLLPLSCTRQRADVPSPAPKPKVTTEFQDPLRGNSRQKAWPARSFILRPQETIEYRFFSGGTHPLEVWPLEDGEGVRVYQVVHPSSELNTTYTDTHSPSPQHDPKCEGLKEPGHQVVQVSDGAEPWGLPTRSRVKFLVGVVYRNDGEAPTRVSPRIDRSSSASIFLGRYPTEWGEGL